jgi:hypothetical protein
MWATAGWDCGGERETLSRVRMWSIGAQNGGNMGLTAFYLGNVGQSIFGLLNSVLLC